MKLSIRRACILTAFVLMTLACQTGYGAAMRGNVAREDTELAKQITDTTTNWTGKVVVLPVHGTLWQENQQFKNLEAAFERIKKETPALIVIEVNSPGGEVDTVGKIGQMILQGNTKTVALVTREAISGGAIVALACNEIEMVKGSTIGDVQPMIGMGMPVEIDERTAEKLESAVRGMINAHAENAGYPKRLVEAMVSRDMEVYKIDLDNGESEFLTKKEVRLLEKNIRDGSDTRKITGRKLIVEEGKLLVLSPKEAAEYGLAERVLDSQQEFFTLRSLEENDLIRVEIPEGDVDVGSLLPSFDMPLWKVLLLGLFLIVGLTGAITEAHMPGFGIPGAISLIGFSCFFVTLAMAGHAEWYEISLFFIGIGLLIVEIVVIPGFGVAGLAGLACLMAGLFLSFMPELGSYNPEDLWEHAKLFILLICGVIVCGFAIWYLFGVYGKKLPIIERMYLQTSLKNGHELAEELREQNEVQTAEDTVRHNPNAHLVGQRGIAETMLRPAGKVRLEGGTLLDVVTEGGILEAGSKVVIKATDMNRILVIPVQDETGNLNA